MVLIACGHPPPTPSKPVPEPEKMSQINAPGAVVDIEKSLVPGYVTVIDFWAEWCGACHVVGEMLTTGVAQEPKILIRKVDVGADAFTPVAAAYQIGGLPHYRVYDKHGKMRYLLVGNDCVKASEIAKQLVLEP
jgi:thiol-disulfide isomerase/thioredoxin